jgi:glycosyltransferase involved in cell wall biosynthesis
MSKPEVTVVMPVYNAAATLDATVASVVEQSFQRFELIAVDDGSGDESLSLLRAHAARDPRIRVLSQANAGASAARNRGVESGCAPFVAFIDADDIWHCEKLERHIALHRADASIAASYARIGFISRKAKSIAEAATLSRLCPWSLRLADVLGENPVCTTSNLVLSRDWFLRGGGFDPSLSFAEDQEFVARLAAMGGRIEGIDAVLTGYRLSPGGLSMDLAAMHAGWRSIAQRFLKKADLAPLEASYCHYLARRALRSGGAPLRALGYVYAGLRKDARAFLRDRRRAVHPPALAAGSFRLKPHDWDSDP